jgi:ABC-type multidrug transport system permease subunit
MSLAAVYVVLAGFAALFLYLGINGFKKRVLS